MDYSDFDTAVDSAKTGGGIDFDSAIDSVHSQNNSSPILDKMASAAKTTGNVFGYPLEKIAQVGRLANQGNQDLANKMAEGGGYLEGRTGVPGLGTAGALAGTTLGTLSQALMPQNKLSAALTVAPALAEGAGMLKNAIAPAAEATEAAANVASKPGVLAQFIQAKVGRGVSLGEAQYAIDHPEVLTEAPSVEEATKGYVDAIGGLKGKAQSLAQRLNKTVITPSDYNEAIDRAGRLLNGTPIEADEATNLTPQDALEGIQSINKALRDKMYTSTMDPAQIREVMNVKDGLMDFMQKNGAPKLKAAAQTLFEANVKDAFSDWIPKNKFGSPDALRTLINTGQLGTAGALALAGHPIAAAPMAVNALLSSPKAAGSLIQNLGALKNSPIVSQGAKLTGLGLSNMIPQQMQNAAQQNGFTIGQQQDPATLAKIQAMRAGMQ